MTHFLRTVLRTAFVLSLCCQLPAARAAEEPAKSEGSRSFLFTSGEKLKSLQPGQSARIWLPVAPTDDDQKADLIELDLPSVARIEREPKYGNPILYLEGKADVSGSIALSLTYRIVRREVSGDASGKASVLPAESTLFLRRDAKVPVGGKSMQLLKGRTMPSNQVDIARLLYDVVDNHLVYRKDKPGWGTGDADWACDSGFGNCTDFHSLFISMARAQHIPAKF